jgi:hypothetical protein
MGGRGERLRVDQRDLTGGTRGRRQIEKLDQPLGGQDQLGVDRMLAPVRFGRLRRQLGEGSHQGGELVIEADGHTADSIRIQPESVKIPLCG